MLPNWSGTLRFLFWRLRAARESSRPCPRTWRRRITAEKKRLLEEVGVDAFVLHAVCVALRRSEYSPAAYRARAVLLRYRDEQEARNRPYGDED